MRRARWDDDDVTLGNLTGHPTFHAATRPPGPRRAGSARRAPAPAGPRETTATLTSYSPTSRVRIGVSMMPGAYMPAECSPVCSSAAGAGGGGGALAWAGTAAALPVPRTVPMTAPVMPVWITTMIGSTRVAVRFAIFAVP